MKTRLLMITPENREINRFRKKQFNNFIQITMPYLAAFVNTDHYEIILIDEYNQKIPYHEKYDLIAITVNTPNASHCYEISRHFRQEGAKVVMGGPHVTLLPQEAQAYCDYLIIGEAEETWPQFLTDFQQGRAKSLYRCKNVPSLDHIPIPRRDLIKKRFFTKGAVFASRGCPYQCSYCNLKQIYCDAYRTRPLQEIIKDIAAIKSRFFVFWDDNLLGDIEFAKELFRRLKGMNKKWAAQVSLDRCKDKELLTLAQEAGCIYFFVGIESFSEDSLEGVNKGFNRVAEYKDIISLIHHHGIAVQAGIVFGFDHDGREVFKDTLKACNKLGIDGATVSILTPLPLTPVYEEMKKQNRLITQDWHYYNGKTRVAFQPVHMSPQELFQGYMWFRREFYSLKSIYKRLKTSRTNIIYNLIVNLGYGWSLKQQGDNSSLVDKK